MKWLNMFLASEPVRAIPQATVAALWRYTAFLVAFVALERLLGKDIQRYRNRSVVNDFVYCIFYNGGYFTLVVWPALKLTEWLLGPYKLDLLPKMPAAVALVLFYLLADFSFYWAHRLLHTKYFWPFHSVHHSQRELTMLTTARFHVVDVVVLTIVTTIPATIFGFAPQIAAVFWVLTMQDKLQHANLDWTYGPLFPVIVSPRFHRIHHATESSMHDRNFGRLFGVWDHLFGTAYATREEPRAFGVEGLEMRESLTAHFTTPFRTLWTMLVRRPAEVPAAPANTAPLET
jgi:sterol desaturase/sphingolipid hydroxylase (fatty acid hydroxylase superfamily)